MTRAAPMHCECLDPFHDGQPCVREPADHGEVMAAPALCLPCLFGCEDHHGTKPKAGEQP